LKTTDPIMTKFLQAFVGGPMAPPMKPRWWLPPSLISEKCQ